MYVISILCHPLNIFLLFCKLILERTLRSENGEEGEMSVWSMKMSADQRVTFDWEIRISDFEMEREIRKPLKTDFTSKKSVLMEDFN